MVYITLILSQSFPIPSYMSIFIYPINTLLLAWLLIKHRSSFSSQTNVNFIFILFLIFIWFLTTSLWAEDKIFTFVRAVMFLIQSLTFFMVGLTISNYFKIEQIKKTIAILVIIFIFITVLSILKNTSWYDFGNGAIAFKGFLKHPNNLGFMAYIGLVSLCFLNLKNISSILLSTFLLIILFLSWSRGAILATIVFYFILITQFTIKKVVLGIITLSFLLTSIYLLNERILLKNEISFGANRYQLIINSVKGAKENFLIGVGYGGSAQNISKTIGEVNSVLNVFQREKMISAVAVVEETGLPGLILWLFMLFLLFKNIKYSKFTNKEKILFLAFIISINVYAQIEAWWVSLRTIAFATFFFFAGFINYKKNKVIIRI